MSGRIRMVGSVTALLALAGIAVVLLGTSRATARSQAVNQKVIVVFKQQNHARSVGRHSLARRLATFGASQRPILAQLRKTHARRVHRYSVINAVSATVSPAEAAALRHDSAVREVVPDGVVHLTPPTTAAAGGAAASGTTPLPGACPAAGQPAQLEPEALQTMSVDSQDPSAKTARSLGIDGSGVKVGWIADSLDPNNPDFIRANGQHVITALKDFSGFGTSAPTSGAESFGDASAIGAQGRTTYDVSHYSALALNRPCNIRVEGVAPGASLVGLVAFGASDIAPDTSILDAIEYAISSGVNVLNESFGINNYPDDATQTGLDLLDDANNQAIADGITVVESTGDAGVTNTTGETATDPNVISAAASTDNRNYIQDGYGGARFPEVKGWLDDEISALSSSGIDQRGRIQDVVAPGESDWALCSKDLKEFAGCASLAGKRFGLQSFGGTSQSSPLTSGVAALVVQAYEKTHGGTPPTPAQVKQFIVSNTDDIGAPADQQGTGRVDAYKAVLAAENDNRPAHGSSQGRKVGVATTSPTQLDAVDAPGTKESLTDTVTNESATTQHLSFSTRTLGAYRALFSTQFTLTGGGPQDTDTAGIPINYRRFTFHVPAGVDRLDASAAFHNANAPSFSAAVRFTLIDPHGNYAGDSRPQGLGNYGDFQVTKPATGTWTAYVYSRDAKDDGYIGPVLFGVRTAKYASFGAVTPARATLAPGGSVAVRVKERTPAQPGDASGAVVVDSSAGGTSPTTSTTVPVSLRSVIEAGDQSFTGTLTGGNGRAPISGQEAFYQLDVPAGQPELNATITLQDPGDQFGAYLIDPQGEAVAYATNIAPSSGGPTPPYGPVDPTEVLPGQVGAQLHALHPIAGRWRLAIAFAPAVSGNALSAPFQVDVNDNAVPASAAGLPHSSATKLAAGTPVTIDAKVKNTGTAPELFFPDARLAGSAPLALRAVSGAGTNLPTQADADGNALLPTYLVPTESTELDARARTTGATPLRFESQPAGGDPDVASTIGMNPQLSVTASPLAQGEWDVLPVEYGVFGKTGPPPETATTSASVMTRPFDPAVSSTGGDLEADSAQPAQTLRAFTPVAVGPGQTGTVPVTITPTGASGTKVSGTLFLDDAAYYEFGSIQDALVNYPQADEVAAIPYSYTIK